MPTVIAVLERDGRIGAVQPNYVYTLQQGGQTGNFAKDQCAVPEMRLTEAHTISNGEKTLVAVIDSGIDSTHPEIAGAITQSCDAVTESCGAIGGGNPAIIKIS